ncbi:ATP synthase F1 subunit delta [Syntrophus aciditrophicus]|uniref:ATP synthase subunit delta n=1 Tax=Syntrophus aciditrophicus (strain SB) TaxID=56780 RepID=ATPD_SYNAS|nr:ATP synthase F1 subunit delta [Syntrophus aciditrophicus]Q2LQZ8.1 RecName: Full=ATP synthase subunit delta; AltName: Full=ATP synthase F(1) sector subunit delta; AltName: Full=F-type ATPase subunit delta; Short=F-ATPase subunit delta [Syntrophus aciditrophicus SB]ABC76508.1 ATP synthase delta chain [Syntrophus aciditrophicus SB]OPY18308.1 MAG: ATP synthase subunit delta [Syntrophus sp. PtaB.Bin075]
MINSGIAKRYARAFFDIAGEDKLYEKYYEELSGFARIVQGDRNLKEFLANPVFNQAEKKAVVEAIIQKIRMSDMTTNFLKLLVDKKRIGMLAEIADYYRVLMDEVLKRVRVSVKTAFPLPADVTSDIKQGLEQMTGKQTEIVVEEDRSLLGGIVIRVGDTLYDGSIKTQLSNIRNLLGEAV